MSRDPLSDFLGLMEPRTVLSGGFSAGGEWALRFPPPDEVKFCAIAKGSCWVRLDGQEVALRAEQGDVALMPGRCGFVIGSSPSATPIDAALIYRQPGEALAQLGDGADFVVLAGGVELDPSSAALLTDALPPLIHVRGASPRAASLRWIIEQIVEERDATSPGTSMASAQLAQLLFTQVLRAHLATADAPPLGWLRAVCDERLAPALQLMHGEPGRAWKLSELAKASAMSRTSFAVYFRAVAGIAPLAYLAEWRMRLAQRTLRGKDASVVEIATTLGYRSESAFSHAFKRVTGSSPRDYRALARGSNDRDGSPNARAFPARA